MICPGCRGPGRSVARETIEAQVIAEIAESAGWALCRSAACRVVYFRGEEAIEIGATRAMPFHKSTDPERLVCFCFAHTAAAVRASAIEPGRSHLGDAIKAACRAGRDDCVRQNPQGRCCLGNVGALIRQGAPAPADCCGSKG